MKLDKEIVDIWKTKKIMTMDGFQSASFSAAVAERFAMLAQSDIIEDGQQEVVMRINFENGKGKYYICLDRPDYTSYPEEKEVLFQAGLRAQIVDFTDVNDGERTEFTLFISDKMVKSEKKKRTLDYAYPVFFYLLDRLFYSIVVRFYFSSKLEEKE